MSKCSNCKNKGEHWHHIVPKSRGGSDNPSNLVFLCLDCHSKAHNVSLKGDNGLIKEATQNAKKDYKKALKWSEENKDNIENFFMSLEDRDQNLHDYLLSGMLIGIIKISDVFNVIFTDKDRAGFRLFQEHKILMRELWKGTVNGQA